MRAATLLLAFAAALPSAFATIYTTSPTASTSWQAGQPQTVQWIEDPNTPKPSLSDMGPCKISIYVGNSQQQTSLQLISPSTNVSNISSVQFTPDPTIGPNSGVYFIRYESISLKDATNPQFPALAFSAKFTLTGMSGQFTPDVQNQINAASSLPVGGSSTGVPSGSTKPPASSSTSSPLKSPTSTSTSSRPSGTGSTQGSSGGALSLTAGKLLTGVASTVVGLAIFL